MHRFDPEQPVDLVEHFAVLPGNDRQRLQVFRRRQPADQRSELDGLGPRAIDDHYVMHVDPPGLQSLDTTTTRSLAPLDASIGATQRGPARGITWSTRPRAPSAFEMWRA